MRLGLLGLMSHCEDFSRMLMLKSEESHSPPSSCRTWRRLHRSTWFLMSIAFGIAVITVVPGEFGKYPDRYSHQQSNNHHAAIVHGWPISFLWRTPFRWLDEPSTSPSAKAWNVTESVRDFSWPALAFDAAFAIVGIAAFTGFVESRRRRRSRFFQFTLRELFV
jgi:hypothetical protein